MSELSTMTGEAFQTVKASDGRSFRLYPLRLSDISQLQEKVGKSSSWNTPEVQAKFQDIDTIAFIIWLGIRRNPDAQALKPEEVADLFEFNQATQIIQRLMEASGLSPKNLPGAAEAGPAAPATGQPSGSTP